MHIHHDPAILTTAPRNRQTRPGTAALSNWRPFAPFPVPLRSLLTAAAARHGARDGGGGDGGGGGGGGGRICVVVMVTPSKQLCTRVTPSQVTLVHAAK